MRNGERCVCEIFPAIDEDQSNTSRHHMQARGILSRRKDGVKIYSDIKHPEVFEIIDPAEGIVSASSNQEVALSTAQIGTYHESARNRER